MISRSRLQLEGSQVGLVSLIHTQRKTARLCCQSSWRLGPSSLSSSASVGFELHYFFFFLAMSCLVPSRLDPQHPQTSSNYPASIFLPAAFFGDQRPCPCGHTSKLFVAAFLLIILLPCLMQRHL